MSLNHRVQTTRSDELNIDTAVSALETAEQIVRNVEKMKKGMDAAKIHIHGLKRMEQLNSAILHNAQKSMSKAEKDAYVAEKDAYTALVAALDAEKRRMKVAGVKKEAHTKAMNAIITHNRVPERVYIQMMEAAEAAKEEEYEKRMEASKLAERKESTKMAIDQAWNKMKRKKIRIALDEAESTKEAIILACHVAKVANDAYSRVNYAVQHKNDTHRLIVDLEKAKKQAEAFHTRLQASIHVIQDIVKKTDRHVNEQTADVLKMIETNHTEEPIQHLENVTKAAMEIVYNVIHIASNVVEEAHSIAKENRSIAHTMVRGAMNASSHNGGRGITSTRKRRKRRKQSRRVCTRSMT